MPTIEIDDKQAICNLLLTTLQATRAHQNLKSLSYQMHENNDETVTASFENQSNITINVSCDSGIALIRDVIAGIN